MGLKLDDLKDVKGSENINNITEYIDDHLNEDLRVEDLAKKCNMSYSYFAKCFAELYGQSCKHYISFLRLCKAENMLLLDNTIVNKTVPLILCTEESVAGSHGATIGKPAEDIIFYMMSRGITRDEAVKILEKASLEAAAHHIEDDDARTYVLGVIADKFTDE